MLSFGLTGAGTEERSHGQGYALEAGLAKALAGRSDGNESSVRSLRRAWKVGKFSFSAMDEADSGINIFHVLKNEAKPP